MEIKATIRGLKNLEKAIGADDKKSKRALKTAIQVEGFSRLKLLRSEMKAGKPGGKAFEALSEIARRTKTGRLKKNQIPLYRLAKLLRYNVDIDRKGDIKLSFGFVNTRRQALSSSYKSLLIKHQEGTDVLYSGSRTELGQKLARIGGRLKKKGDPDAQYFFLRKTTGRKIDLPERGIIDPFYIAYQGQMWKNIGRNYRKKMRGERI